MRDSIWRAIDLTAVTLILLTFQNCGPAVHREFDTNGLLNSPSSVGLPAGYTLEVDQALQTQALAILNNKCASCHQTAGQGGINGILDVNHLIGLGLITAGDPTKGRLIGAIQDGSMPKGGTISAGETQTLRDWISSMKLTGTVPVPTGPLPAGKTVQVDTALHARAIQILNVNCAGCHQNIVSGGVGDILDVKKLVASGLVTAGDASKGRLIGAIADGSMPKGNGARVTAADLQTLKDWIASITIVNDTGQAAPEGRLPLSPTFGGVYANIIQPKCIACHGPVKQEDKRFDSYNSVKSNTSKIVSECQSQSMPRSPYPAVTTEEMAALRAWVNAGALNN